MIAVLDYGIGNLRSAQKALVKVGADAVLVTGPDQAEGAAGVVLPGVGAFGRCMEALVASGLDKVATDAAERDIPFLAICIGMQLLYQASEEDPGVAGLGPRPWFYFVHSYAPGPGPDVVATCDYGGQVVAAVERGRMWATQFHPEKSGGAGLHLLRNFATACGGAG